MNMGRFEDTEIKFLKGIGEARAKLLASELEISDFRGLLEYYPFRYADRSRFYRIAELQERCRWCRYAGILSVFLQKEKGPDSD